MSRLFANVDPAVAWILGHVVCWGSASVGYAIWTRGAPLVSYLPGHFLAVLVGAVVGGLSWPMERLEKTGILYSVLGSVVVGCLVNVTWVGFPYPRQETLLPVVGFVPFWIGFRRLTRAAQSTVSNTMKHSTLAEFAWCIIQVGCWSGYAALGYWNWGAQYLADSCLIYGQIGMVIGVITWPLEKWLEGAGLMASVFAAALVGVVINVWATGHLGGLLMFAPAGVAFPVIWVTLRRWFRNRIGRNVDDVNERDVA